MQKKRILVILLSIMLICCTFFIAGCDVIDSFVGGNGEQNQDINDGKETPEHTHSYVLKYDSEKHWEECECGDKKDSAVHSGGTATCEKKAKCYICEQEYGDLKSHNYVNGRCECLKYEPTYYTDGLFFTLNSSTDTYSVTDYTGSSAEVVIPSLYQDKAVTSIGDDAFSGCTSLMSIEIPNSVTSIGDYAFYNCDSLTYNTKDGLKYLGNSSNPYLYLADTESTSLTTANIDDNCKFIGSSAFWCCRSLTSVTIPNSVTSIGSSAFWCCSSLTSIEIPNSVTSIGEAPFYGCDSLTYNTKDGLKYLGNSSNPYLYLADAESTSITTANIDDNCKLIGPAFSGCSSLTCIQIPNSVTCIGGWAFYNCSSLTSIEIPNSVTCIGSSAFYWCSKLIIYCETESKPSGWDSDWNYSKCPVVWECNNNDVADDGKIYTVIDGIRYSINNNEATVTLQPRNITTANIPSSIVYKGSAYSVTSIGDYAFYDCDSLTSIEIPNSVTSIGAYAFKYCSSLTSITVDSNNANYKDIDGNLYSKDGKTLIQYASGKTATSFTIPSTVTSIGSYAFSGCSSLTSIEIPNSVTSISEFAFRGCSSLTSVTFGENSQLTSIGDYAFSNCSSLTSVTFGENSQLTSIGRYAFEYCSSLTSIEIPNSVTNIWQQAFEGCSSLTIYCEAESQPSGWDSNWNYDNRPVVWGYKGEK